MEIDRAGLEVLDDDACRELLAATRWGRVAISLAALPAILPVRFALEGDTIVVGAPDQFAADWNESKHAGLLAGYAPIALGHPLRVVFRVHEERKARPQMDFFVAPPAAAAPPEPPARRGNGTGPGNSPLSDRYVFEHFVIGKSN